MDGILAALPYLAGVVAAATAIRQLTLAPRLRRLETWARNARSAEKDAVRAEELQTIEHAAVASLVSLMHVPAYRYATAIFVPLVAAIPLVAAMKAKPSIVSGAVAVLIASISTALFLRYGISVYRERQRIAKEYFAGSAIKPANIGLLTGWTPGEAWLAIRLAVGLSCGVAGVALMFTAEQPSIWMLMLCSGGFVLAAEVFTDLHRESVMTALRHT